MTLGTGILLSTILVLTAFALNQITKHGKWRTVGKWVGVMAACAALAGLAVWGWVEYQQRPQLVESLDDVKLGMSKLDVKLAKGEGTELLDDDGKPNNIWLYKSGSDTSLTIHFTGEAAEEPKVSIVCTEGGYSSLLGFNSFNSEDDVLQKLGTPSNTSVHAAGLTKLISFAPYKVAYHIAKGQVTEVCITSAGKIAFEDEYGKSDSKDIKP